MIVVLDCCCFVLRINSLAEKIIPMALFRAKNHKMRPDSDPKVEYKTWLVDYKTCKVEYKISKVEYNPKLTVFQ